MDGKLLILCDEMPGTYNSGPEEYKIRDSRFLVQEMRLPEDDVDRIFVSWDSIIPEDRSFIEACKHYAKFTEKPGNPLFPLSRKGSTNPEEGTIKDSVQEESYFATYENHLTYLQNLMQTGKDWKGEAIELGVQYTFAANERFFDDFTKLLNNNGVVAILPCFSEQQASSNITRYRMELLEAWKTRNETRKQSGFRKVDEFSAANVLKLETYSDFGEILYVKSTNEIMKIYSMPFFGESSGNSSHDDEPEL